MAKGKKDDPEIVRAAAGLDDEIAKLEALSRSIRKIRLDSEKNLERARKELGEALTLPQGLASGLQALAAAIEHLQVRQQAALEPLAACASDIQQRSERLGEHMLTYAALGKAAGELTLRLQSSNGDRGATIAELGTALERIGGEAKALADAARAEEFPEIAREADALRQRMVSLRRRIEV